MKINEIINEGKTGPGLWANIHAKRKRGERMREKGEEGAPTEKALKAAQAGSKNESVSEDSDPCWDTHKQVGMKTKGGRKVPNCVPKEGVAEGYDDEEHPIRDDGNEGQPGKQRYPGKLPNKGVAEGEKKPHPETWHDVDPKLGRAVDKMSQAEKVKKGLAHPDTLKKKGVAEGSTGNDDIARLKSGEKTSDGIGMQDIRLMAGEGKLPTKTVLQALAVIRKQRSVTEGSNGEYDDESGMAETNLHTIARAAQGLLDTIDDNENLPEWVQEKIAKVEGMMVTAWDYLKSQEEQGVDPRVDEGLNDTQKKIEDTINKLENRLKHAKSDEQWDRISARIERLQAGLKRSKQGVAEGLNEPPVSYREMINSVQKQYTKWYSELVNHYAQLGNSSDEFKKKIVAAYNAYKNGQSVAHIPIVGPVKEQGVADKGSQLEETYHDDDEFFEAYGVMEYNDEMINESEYQGRKVTLNKPMQGDSKKFKVFVKNEKGNVVKVNFGQKGARIKKNNPGRRKNFRARHNCDNPGPKTGARYWSCRAW